jgi:hypothetical protein
MAAASRSEDVAGPDNLDSTTDPSLTSTSRKRKSKTLEESLLRAKRRRQLRSLLQKAGDFPSFVSIISTSQTDDAAFRLGNNGDAMEEQGQEEGTEPDTIVIDVDEYLGLNKHNNNNNIINNNKPLSTKNRSMIGLDTNRKLYSPAEEGYYEGRVTPMASPDDEKYLTSLQQLIRQHLEIFSATATDAAGSQAGRRFPIVQGKVGIRCIHCAKVGLEHEAAKAQGLISKTPNNKIWPPGSISYPNNIAGIYSVCSQKPQLHFENCPNTPGNIKSQFYRHTRESSRGNNDGRSKSKEVPAAMYYNVASKRLGLVDVPGKGIRFGRDLKLEPLPLEAVLAQESQESEEIKSQTVTIIAYKEQPELVGSGASVSDPIAQQVFAEAVAEQDDPTRFLARMSDRHMVTEYMFLCLRQMAICHTLPADLTSRGKKSKKMRLGFAGFSCRHCREALGVNELGRALGSTDNSCRSFSSAAENLSSAITNAFASHISKCSNIPEMKRHALSEYKRHHARQLQELPYGSQRKVFQEIWLRLREADVEESEMKQRILHHQQEQGGPDAASLAANVGSSNVSLSSRDATIEAKATIPRTNRDPNFPTSNDSETQRILSMFEHDWDLSSNCGLIMPDDRELVSDYVFLTTRQLKVSIPTTADVAKSKKAGLIAGVCCMHCEGKDPALMSASNRSFANAPDNFASAFNTSLYNHMQGCPFVKADLKRALAILRKLHSQQLQALQFGSQRKFFNLLYNRLKAVPLPGNLPVSPRKPSPVPVPSSSRHSPKPVPSSTSEGGSSSKRRPTRQSESADAAILDRFSFFEAPCQSFFCLRCRMVPLQFRARGSLSFARPSLELMTEHHEACKGDGFDLWFILESMKKLLKTTDFDVKYMTDPLFKEVVLECFGRNEDLANIFTNEIVKVYQMSRHGGITRAVENYIKAKSQGLWSMLPQTVDSSKVSQAYRKFSAAAKGAPLQISDNTALSTYLRLVSPSLNLSNAEDAAERDESGDGEEGIEAERTASEGESDPDGDDEDFDEGEDVGDVEEAANGAAPSQLARKPRRGKELRRSDSHGDDEEVEQAAGDQVIEIDIDSEGLSATIQAFKLLKVIVKLSPPKD